MATQADVRDYDALKQALDEGVAQLGRLDIVSANAGIVSYDRAEDLAEQTWQDVIDVNLTGEWHAAKAAIPHLRAAGGGQVEVLLDGGIRRGGDVVKAVALGARAVMIGRAYLWGLAANGQAGVENVLDILRGGIDSALLGLGKASIGDLTPDDVVVPPGFTRTLGSDGPDFDPAPNGQTATG